MTCVGVGGGDITEGAGMVSSVRLVGGAAVVLYPNGYGDRAGVGFSADVDDLANVPYGVDGDFRVG